jgi:hypothetical protein
MIFSLFFEIRFVQHTYATKFFYNNVVVADNIVYIEIWEWYLCKFEIQELLGYIIIYVHLKWSGRQTFKIESETKWQFSRLISALLSLFSITNHENHANNQVFSNQSKNTKLERDCHEFPSIRFLVSSGIYMIPTAEKSHDNFCNFVMMIMSRYEI